MPRGRSLSSEKAFWRNVLKPVLHQPGNSRVAWKVEDRYRAGIPDLDVCIHGNQSKVELKYLPWKEAYDDPQAEVVLGLRTGQVRHLKEWDRAGGLGFVLVGIGREWWIFGPQVQKKGLVREYRTQALLTGWVDDLSPLVDFLSSYRHPEYR